MSREFEFDPLSQRYRVINGPGKGQYISYDAIANLTEQYIEQSKIEIDSLTNQLLNRQIKVSDWERLTAKQLRDAHTNAYALGFGGIGRMGEREKSDISDRIRTELQYLRGFSEDILNGKLSEAQILDRASLYVDALHGTRERGTESAHYLSGFDEERRLRNAVESCQDCIDYAAYGWVSIGSLPWPGSDCQCRSRCRCHKEFRKSSDQQNSFDLLTQSNGWISNPMETTFKMQTQSPIVNPAGNPTPEQLAKINRYSSLGDITADDVVTVPFYASNNLLWHSNGAWTVPALSNMGELLMGRQFIMNHDWHDISKSHGKIYDYQLLYSVEAPQSAIDQAGDKEINQYIVQRNGYARLILHVYFESGSKILQDIRFGRIDSVSTGVLTAGNDSFICPICSERFGKDIRFNERDDNGKSICPHDIPTPFMLWLFEDDTEANFAPFYYRTLNKSEGAHGIELSAVLAPDLPLAGTITPNKMDVL